MSDSIWEYFGENDPYFAVNTISEMRSEDLDEEKIKLFFERGEDYIKTIWREIEEHFLADFQPKRALDFGCGVARMTLPIAKRSQETVGVDISTSMLHVAQKNAERFGVKNVSFVKGDDTISKVTGAFDFIHSIVVFQHIKPKIGVGIFQRMVEMLSEDGIGVLHVTYADSVSTRAQKLRFSVYRDLPVFYKLRNVVLRKRNEPLIPIYLYNLNQLMLILQQNDCHNCQVRFSQHGFDGVLLFFQKKRKDLY
ncbi:MAG TPA: class I SAM-dependent methyltransferase [Pyrinomonadaceae bacterium]|jgi:2-polyprenyl-3-methyl-5-hydroxy-6-metoxy-1,4-benzoquinol methylase